MKKPCRSTLETAVHALLVAFVFAGAVVVHVTSSKDGAPPVRWPFVGRDVRYTFLERLVADRELRIYDRSERPRVLEIEGLLSDEECDHIVARAAASNGMKRSWTVRDEDGGAAYGDGRTSSTVFLDPRADRVMLRIGERVANLTLLPLENSEHMQVVHYRPGQHYWAHHDYLPQEIVRSSWRSYRDGYRADNRFVTVLFYLNDVERGGETVFPRYNPYWDAAEHGYAERVCDENYPALRIRPRKGNAIVFYNMDGWALDESSLHAGCDPLSGDKWAANFWLHTRPFEILGKYN